MKKILVFLLLLATIAHAQREFRVEITSAPSWVKQYDYSKDVKDTANCSGGYYNLLSDEQFNGVSHEAFYHYAQKVVSENGLENISTISQNFDPAFEKLEFHSISVIRNDRLIDQLTLGEFQVLKREQNLERLIYDGNLTAVFNLYDIQVGDILDYSYTVKGQNPLFGTRFSKLLYLNFSVPVGLLVRRIVVDGSHEYQLKKFNQAPEPVISMAAGKKTYEWALKEVPAHLLEESVPGWYDPYDHIQISDFGSWKDLSLWATNLFDVNKGGKELLSKVPGLKKNNKEEAVRRVIQFVQDEVRYLSFSDGIHGYKPHASEKILMQRFGDCKDKSLLLSSLLKELGVHSEPVLVNTGYGKTLSDYLPAPYLFNHCIVRFTLHDSTYWVDPTVSMQRGSIKKIFTPHYYQGLVVAKDAKTLAEMPRSTNGSIETTEEYFLDKVGGGATLIVKTAYTLDEADNMRSYFKSNSSAQVQKQYLNFYATDFPDIKTAEQLKWTDYESENRIASTETYDIESFWHFDSVKQVYSFSAYPRNLASYLVKPATKIRETPFSLRYPTYVNHKIILHMPEEWSMAPSDKTIESAGFVYQSKSTYSDKTIFLSFLYRAKKSYLDHSEVRDYMSKIEAVSNDLNFTVSKDITVEEQKTFNTPFLIFLLGTLVICYFGLKRLDHFDPEPHPSFERHSTIGGWLILPAIGLCISPPRLLYEFLQSGFFNHTHWRILTDASFGAYDPSLGLFVLAEMMLNAAITLYSIFVVYMFFKRRSNVPILASVFYVASVSLIILDTIVATFFDVAVDNDTMKEIVRGIVGAAIWVPYFLLSQRSKGTFTVRKYHPTDFDTSAYSVSASEPSA